LLQHDEKPSHGVTLDQSIRRKRIGPICAATRAVRMLMMLAAGWNTLRLRSSHHQRLK